MVKKKPSKWPWCGGQPKPFNLGVCLAEIEQDEGVELWAGKTQVGRRWSSQKIEIGHQTHKEKALRTVGRDWIRLCMLWTGTAAAAERRRKGP